MLLNTTPYKEPICSVGSTLVGLSALTELATRETVVPHGVLWPLAHTPHGDKISPSEMTSNGVCALLTFLLWVSTQGQ